jgi:hypothetical protein
MITQKEQKDISWLDKGYDVVVKIAGDIEKLEQKSGALMAHLKNKEFYINYIWLYCRCQGVYAEFWENKCQA